MGGFVLEEFILQLFQSHAVWRVYQYGCHLYSAHILYPQPPQKLSYTFLNVSCFLYNSLVQLSCRPIGVHCRVTIQGTELNQSLHGSTSPEDQHTSAKDPCSSQKSVYSHRPIFLYNSLVQLSCTPVWVYCRVTIEGTELIQSLYGSISPEDQHTLAKKPSSLQKGLSSHRPIL